MSATTSMRRRMVGYSPAAVAEVFRQNHDRHSQEMSRLRRELEQAREKAAALARQIAVAEAKAQSTEVLVHTLTARILEWINQRAGAIRTLGESNVRAEHELRTELERLHAVLAHLQESQSRFGHELGSLTRRFRDEVASLRLGVPAPTQGEDVPVQPTLPARQQQPTFPGERKESAIK